MNVIGKWKIAAALTLNDQFEQVWKTVSEMAADPEVDPFDLQMFDSLIIFGEDGVIKTAIKIPEDLPQEEIDAAIASGECELYAPGLMVVEKREWKEEDGKIKFKSGVEGEILGEEVDPWVEIIPLENGIEYGTFRLTRADD